MDAQPNLIGHNGSPLPTVAEFQAMTRDAQILTWDAMKAQLDQFKALEVEMRKHIVDTNSHGFDAETIGTQNVDLGNGWTLKAVIKQNYRLDTDADKVEAALDKLPDWQADRLVKWTPAMSKREYDELDADGKAAIDEVLTISTSSPTLSLVAPKAK